MRVQIERSIYYLTSKSPSHTLYTRFQSSATIPNKTSSQSNKRKTHFETNQKPMTQLHPQRSGSAAENPPEEIHANHRQRSRGNPKGSVRLRNPLTSFPRRRNPPPSRARIFPGRGSRDASRGVTGAPNKCYPMEPDRSFLRRCPVRPTPAWSSLPAPVSPRRPPRSRPPVIRIPRQLYPRIASSSSSPAFTCRACVFAGTSDS